MENEIRICDECKATNVKTLLPQLKEVDSEAEIIVGCQSYCGIGHKKVFAIVNGRHMTASSEQELVNKVEKVIKRAARRKPSTTT